MLAPRAKTQRRERHMGDIIMFQHRFLPRVGKFILPRFLTLFRSNTKSPPYFLLIKRQQTEGTRKEEKKKTEGKRGRLHEDSIPKLSSREERGRKPPVPTPTTNQMRHSTQHPSTSMLAAFFSAPIVDGAQQGARGLQPASRCSSVRV